MYTTELIYQGALRCNATHVRSGIQIETDAPTDNNGKGERFSPTDLVAAALGSCMLTVMGIEAEKHQIDLSGSSIKLTKVMGIGPRRIVALKGELQVYHSACSPEQIELLKQTALNCPVAKSIHTDIRQEIELNFILKG